MQQVTELPAEVLDQLGPVLASLRAEVQQGVAAVAKAKVNHAGRVVVRSNGGGGYEDGFKAIVADVFPGQAPDPRVVVAGINDADSERDCSCNNCEDGACDGGCETCDDHGCSQCHDVSTCCGYCSSCETCHTSVDGVGRYIVSNNDGVEFCTSCDHFCND
jgi:hypothetical protein